MSSDNSFNSQTTVTQYAKYGLTPVMHESSSTSSRSLSRLSNYSATSSNTTTGIPRPRTTSNNSIIPTPSRSFTQKKEVKRTVAKRASHIPAPSNYISSPPPTPQRTISSSSATSRLRVPTQAKRLPQRASHIPTVRESIHRPNSPLQPSKTPTRMTLRSPTPNGPRNSLFPPKDEKKRATTPQSSSLRSPSRIGTLKKINK